MANTFDIGTHGLPNPDSMAPGNAIKTGEIRALTGSINHAWAEVYAQPVVSQSWPDEFVEVVGSAAATICTWRIPRLTEAHTSIWCEVYAAGGGVNGGTIYFASAKSGNAATIAVAAGGAYAFAGATLELGTLDTYDTITMTMEAGQGLGAGNGTVTLTAATMAYEPLTSPLATTAYSTPTVNFYPFGETVSGANYPLSSARGNRIFSSLSAIRNSPRVLFQFSGVDTTNITSASDAADAHPWIGQDPYAQNVPTWMGSLRAGVEYTVHALCEPHGTTDTQINLRIGERWMDDMEDAALTSITVSASAAGDTWVTTTFRLDDQMHSIGSQHNGVEWPHARIGLYPIEWGTSGGARTPGLTGAGQARRFGRTNARVKSLVIWGE